MDAILAALEKREIELHPPATPDAIRAISGSVQHLPAEFVRLYEHHAGMPEDCGLPMRLMSPTEAVETARAIAGTDFEFFSDGAERFLFWTDDNSNFAGVFLRGDLAGRVFFVDHEEPYDTPAFRSVVSFYERMIEAYDDDLDWYEMRRDYPSIRESESQFESAEDRALARYYVHAYLAGGPDADVRNAFIGLALLGFADTDAAVPLIDSDDMWVQEAACNLMGLRQYESAVPKLKQVASSGKANGRTASILALKKINNAEAINALAALKPQLEAEGLDYLLR